MRSLLKTLAILLLVALIPLRAMAAVTIGFCPSGHADMAVAAHVGDGHVAGEHAHDGNTSASGTSGPSCNVCAEHCSSAAIAPPAETTVDVRPLGCDLTLFASRDAPAFFPDQLDRPPLA
jgi:hypothetical protein